MRYLVCVPINQILSEIRIYDDPNAMVSEPFEVWTLDSGRKIMAVERRVGREIAKFHIGGSYTSGARYAIAYEEMCLILEFYLGKHDRALLIEAQNQLKILRTPGFSWPKTRIVGYALWKSACLISFTVGKALGMLLWFGIIAIVLKLLSQHKK